MAHLALRKCDFALEAILHQHDSHVFFLNGGDDGLFGAVSVFEVVVGVVVAGSSRCVSGHAVAHVHLLADLAHLQFVYCVIGEILMKVGSGSRSMAAASRRCTRTSAYLRIGEVKWV